MLPALLSDLLELQDQLQSACDRLRVLRALLGQAEAHNVFLSRRLGQRCCEEQSVFVALTAKFHHILAQRLSHPLVIFHASDDVQTLFKIRRTLRYIHYAFAGEPPVGMALARLSASLSL